MNIFVSNSNKMQEELTNCCKMNKLSYTQIYNLIDIITNYELINGSTVFFYESDDEFGVGARNILNIYCKPKNLYTINNKEDVEVFLKNLLLSN